MTRTYGWVPQGFYGYIAPHKIRPALRGLSDACIPVSEIQPGSAHRTWETWTHLLCTTQNVGSHCFFVCEGGHGGTGVEVLWPV